MTAAREPRGWRRRGRTTVVAALVAVALLGAALASPADAVRKRPRRTPCPGGVFQVIGDPLVPSGILPLKTCCRSPAPCRSRAAARRQGEAQGHEARHAPEGVVALVSRSAWPRPDEGDDRAAHVLYDGRHAASQGLQAVVPGGRQQLIVPPTIEFPPFTLPADPVCGDGIRTADEFCDDGNTVGCDGCSGDCFRHDAQCGDGYVECGEQCDGYGCAADERCEGCRCVPDATAATCAEASTCDDKKYCGSLNCLCIGSAEGVVGCGGDALLRRAEVRRQLGLRAARGRILLRHAQQRLLQRRRAGALHRARVARRTRTTSCRPSRRRAAAHGRGRQAEARCIRRRRR